VDVIQTHLARSVDLLTLSLSGPVRRGLRPSVLWTVHNERLELRTDQVPGGRHLRTKRVAYRFAYRAGSWLGADFLAVSDVVAATIGRTYRPRPGSIHEIPNGVDVARFRDVSDRAITRDRYAIPQDARVVITVAMLQTQKGHRDLIAAIAGIHPRIPGLQLLLVGDGPLRAELEGDVQARGLGDIVRFVGLTRDVPDLLAASDIFVLPSLWEGLPMALLEAMAAGLPAVATAVSGTAQVLEDGVSGLLVPPDDAAGLATAIESLIRDPGLASRLALAGRSRVEARFSVDEQARRYADLYARLRRRRPGTA
jgi:glycosyltransferase involved in cell wall biosynthesis